MPSGGRGQLAAVEYGGWQTSISSTCLAGETVPQDKVTRTRPGGPEARPAGQEETRHGRQRQKPGPARPDGGTIRVPPGNCTFRVQGPTTICPVFDRGSGMDRHLVSRRAGNQSGRPGSAGDRAVRCLRNTLQHGEFGRLPRLRTSAVLLLRPLYGHGTVVQESAAQPGQEPKTRKAQTQVNPT